MGVGVMGVGWRVGEGRVRGRVRGRKGVELGGAEGWWGSGMGVGEWGESGKEMDAADPAGVLSADPSQAQAGAFASWQMLLMPSREMT